jgi:hypothetical protein
MSLAEKETAPTTDDIREAYQYSGAGLDSNSAAWRRRELFDEWLASNPFVVPSDSPVDLEAVWLRHLAASQPRATKPELRASAEDVPSLLEELVRLRDRVDQLTAE